MTDFRERRAAIEARLAAATPGAWVYERAWNAFRTVADCGHLHCVNAPVSFAQTVDERLQVATANAALIAHAPDDLRACMARIDELEAGRAGRT